MIAKVILIYGPDKVFTVYEPYLWYGSRQIPKVKVSQRYGVIGDTEGKGIAIMTIPPPQ